jgi:hypothetical protein
MRNTVKVTVAAMVMAVVLTLGGISMAKDAPGTCGAACKAKCEAAAVKCETQCKKDEACRTRCEATKTTCESNKTPAPKK